jgi:alkylation response protein AidB-like acyl-CoA dehydrogenase
VDDDDRRLLLESLAQTVTGAAPGGLRAAIMEFGWGDLLAEEPAVAVSSLAALEGEYLSDTTLLDDMVLAGAGIAGSAHVVYPDPPHCEPTAHVDEETISVTGLMTGGHAPHLVIPARRGDVVVIVTTDALGTSTAPPGGLDPDASWCRVQARLALASADLLDGTEARERWQAMRAAGHRALAHQLTAIGRCMLTMAVEHVNTRHQFGHLLGSFQAVKHALADVRVWQDCAEQACEAAWEDSLPESAQLAKILAGRFVRTAAANCQQVLGGMGFTWEHPFHRYLRRALLLEPVLGSAAQLRGCLGARLRAAGLPRLAEL